MIDKKTIQENADKIFPKQIEWRRHLHQNPELSNEEFKTTTFIKSILNKYKIEYSDFTMETGLVGFINKAKKPAVAVRTDIDALPIIEHTDLPFKSKNIGVMHACGHDVHMAVVLGTAVLLNNFKDKIPGSIKFLFQPAEESPPGGAERLIKAGVMKSPDVKMIFGLHVDPTLPTGEISLRDGPTMASVIDVDIVILGQGGHAAIPHRAIDAIVVASEVVESLQKVISRETNPLSPVLLTFGSIEGGTARNIIADKVTLKGTARTLSKENIKLLPRLIKRTVAGICRARGAKYELNILSSYPVLDNHSSANKILRACYEELYGSKKIQITLPTMGGEDFSFYLEKSSGAMFRLGVKNIKIGADKSWHAHDFIADEQSIRFGTELLSMAVIRYWEENQ
ncbi:MAG: amidohydrolase [Candidatus Zixiibacteriota bacterium]